jgi:hypothetical protein
MEQYWMLKLTGVAMSCSEIIDKLPPEYRKIAIQILDSGYDEDGKNTCSAEAEEKYKQGKLVEDCSCGEPGTFRFDNGLPCGSHCDKCWERIVTEARGQSW